MRATTASSFPMKPAEQTCGAAAGTASSPALPCRRVRCAGQVRGRREPATLGGRRAARGGRRCLRTTRGRDSDAGGRGRSSARRSSGNRRAAEARRVAPRLLTDGRDADEGLAEAEEAPEEAGAEDPEGAPLPEAGRCEEESLRRAVTAVAAIAIPGPSSVERLPEVQ